MNCVSSGELYGDLPVGGKKSNIDAFLSLKNCTIDGSKGWIINLSDIVENLSFFWIIFSITLKKSEFLERKIIHNFLLAIFFFLNFLLPTKQNINTQKVLCYTFLAKVKLTCVFSLVEKLKEQQKNYKWDFSLLLKHFTHPWIFHATYLRRLSSSPERHEDGYGTSLIPNLSPLQISYRKVAWPQRETSAETIFSVLWIIQVHLEIRMK